MFLKAFNEIRFSFNFFDRNSFRYLYLNIMYNKVVKWTLLVFKWTFSKTKNVFRPFHLNTSSFILSYLFIKGKRFSFAFLKIAMNLLVFYTHTHTVLNDSLTKRTKTCLYMDVVRFLLFRLKVFLLVFGSSFPTIFPGTVPENEANRQLWSTYVLCSVSSEVFKNFHG